MPLLVTPNMLETKASLSYVTGAHALKAGFRNLSGEQTDGGARNDAALLRQLMAGPPPPAR